MEISFENLDKIIDILEKLDSLNSKILNIENKLTPKLDLTKRDGVIKYLNVSNSTITRYISEGIFKEGYHYHRELKNNTSKIIFVSGAIEEFKKEKTK